MFPFNRQRKSERNSRSDLTRVSFLVLLLCYFFLFFPFSHRLYGCLFSARWLLLTRLPIRLFAFLYNNENQSVLCGRTSERANERTNEEYTRCRKKKKNKKKKRQIKERKRVNIQFLRLSYLTQCAHELSSLIRSDQRESMQKYNPIEKNYLMITVLRTPIKLEHFLLFDSCRKIRQFVSAVTCLKFSTSQH